MARIVAPVSRAVIRDTLPAPASMFEFGMFMLVRLMKLNTSQRNVRLLFSADTECLVERPVQLYLARSANRIASGVSKLKWRRNAKDAGIEPLVTILAAGHVSWVGVRRLVGSQRGVAIE